jgi:hypothetical protein
LPRRERPEWLAEWRAECHHVLTSGGGSHACIAFLPGALPDALWIRKHSHCPRTRLDSPRRCLVSVGLLAGLSVTLAFLLPPIRREILPAAYIGPDDIVTISPVPSMVGSGMQVSASQYREWSAHHNPELAQTAFYAPTVADVRLGARNESWYMGKATPSLVDLLSGQVSKSLIETCRQSGIRAVMLSHATWIRVFAANPDIAGHVLQIAGQKAMIVAVAPETASDLPLQMDAWSLESEEAMHKLSLNRFAYGYMLAKLAPSARVPYDFSSLNLISDDGEPTRLYEISMAGLAEYHRRIPAINFLLSLFLTCLALPAILSISLRTGLVTEHLSLKMRTRGWLFVCAKTGLLLPLLYCGPLLVTHLLATGMHDSGYAIQSFITCGASLLAAFWVIDDQRQRCPICLRKLASPARVGEQSRSFLGFSGVEFVCADGHGLMHVPDFPTSWFANQRWSPLDASWSGLFQPGN